jgi:hypothetical protein
MPAWRRRTSKREIKVFFYEKKKQKTLALCFGRSGKTLAASSRNKSLFASFSSEKEDSSFRSANG